jgi:hypothetical protein
MLECWNAGILEFWEPNPEHPENLVCDYGCSSVALCGPLWFMPLLSFADERRWNSRGGIFSFGASKSELPDFWAELGLGVPRGEELTHALSDHKLVAAQVTRYGIGCDRRRNG